MEDYVTFEQAQKLKELGFDWNCRGSYNKSGSLKISAYTYNFNDGNEWSKYTYSAPSLAQAAKWLREKGIDITPIPITRGNERIYRWALDRLNPRLQDWTDDLINTYEQALSAGIDKALELLKQI